MKRARQIMGAIVVVAFFVSNPCQAQGILLPPSPKPVPTPGASEEEFDRRLREKRERRQQKIKKDNPEKSPKQIRDKELFDESLKKRNYDLFLQLNLLYPQISTSGDLKNFTTEITTHFLGAYKWKEIKTGNQRFYAGLRAASFSGTGVVSGVPARYSFMYYGPVLAWSKISTDVKKQKSKRRPAGEAGFVHVTGTKSGWLALTGVSARSTQVSTDTPKEGLPDEWLAGVDQKRKISVWGELQQHTIFFGVLSMNFNLGFQASDKKNFLWAGMGAATWY